VASEARGRGSRGPAERAGGAELGALSPGRHEIDARRPRARAAVDVERREVLARDPARDREHVRAVEPERRAARAGVGAGA
jgi:hypothetical protein